MCKRQRPNFARNLSRDMHLTPTSMTSQIVYDVLISTPDFSLAFFSICESLTSCNLVLNKAIRLEFGEEDGVDMGIGEFLSSEVFLLLRFSAGVIERMFLLLQYDISSFATATVCTDVYPRPDLNSLWGSEIGGIRVAMCLTNELCYKCGEKVSNDRDDIEVDAIKDAFINNLRQMLGHARSIYCLTKDTLKILPATSDMLDFFVCSGDTETYLENLIAIN